jgi:hypothetical protein
LWAVGRTIFTGRSMFHALLREPRSLTVRADSWICASAIHAGLIHPTFGGCISLTALPFTQGSSNFQSSTSNGLTSASFLPSFPGAYALSRIGRNGCLDIHPIVSVYNAICLFLLTALMSPSPWVLMHILVFLGFTQIVFISNPRSQPPDWEYVFASFGPVIFVGYWAYKISFKRTIEGFRRLPFELAFWQGGGFWVGVESAQIFSRLPIDRLGYDALDPAGVITLVIILVIVVIVAVIQAWALRKVGLLQYYLLRSACRSSSSPVWRPHQLTVAGIFRLYRYSSYLRI